MGLKGFGFSAGGKRIRVLLAFAYVLIMIILYTAFILSARYGALDRVKSEMLQKLDTFLMSVDAEFDRKVWFAKSLAESDSLIRPLNFDMGGQVREYLGENEELSKGVYKLVVTDKNNKSIFNNTDGLNDLSSLSVSKDPYSSIIYSGRIYYVNYIPVKYKDIFNKGIEKRLGTVVSAYDFLDFYKLAPNNEKGISYDYYGYANGTLCFRIEGGKPIHENSPVNPHSIDKFKGGFTWLNIDGKNTLVLLKSKKLLNSSLPFFISTAVSPEQLSGIETSYMLSGIFFCSIAALLITGIMLLVFYLLRKDYINKLEIIDLRTQRHDFSKHLGVIRGITELGELDELKRYLDCVSEKVSFEGELSRIGCPPLTVLLKEKEAVARGQDIDFRIKIVQSLGGLHMNPDDLCMVVGNIIDNAIEASAENADNSERIVLIEIELRGEYYCFKVSNSGQTITEKQIERIFKPGYTTKKDGKGRGMGLYIVSRTLKKYRGSVQVDSGGGVTTFTVFVPVKKK